MRAVQPRSGAADAIMDAPNGFGTPTSQRACNGSDAGQRSARTHVVMPCLPSLIALALLAGNEASAALGTTARPVRLGQTAYVSGPRVTPIRVIEDSRCPMNARCVRAGTVVIRARVSGGRWSRTLDMTLGQPVSVADGSLVLTTVSPDPIAGRPLAGERLRFTFAFQGGL